MSKRIKKRIKFRTDDCSVRRLRPLKKEFFDVWEEEQVDNKLDSLLADEDVDQKALMSFLVKITNIATQRAINKKIVPLDVDLVVVNIHIRKEGIDILNKFYLLF